ncbi:hypothetical protein HY633_03190 [Candidatus Uhrbacteria bacterium]|nr:hypothetical protein [Candidatus Uhrbacteria bacterium]
MNPVFKNAKIRAALAVFGGVILLLAAFQAGIHVGYRKAGFAYQWGENYHRVFGGPGDGFMREARGRGPDFMAAHGIFGTILKVDGDEIVIAGQDGVERTVVVDAATEIRGGRERFAAAALVADERVVVIGEPDGSGRLLAKFMRVFPKDEPLPSPRQKFRR